MEGSKQKLTTQIEKEANENIGNLKKNLEEAKKLSEERLQQLKYMQADFENYRKRFEKEREQIVKLANESLIRELIVVLDDFDAAIKLSVNEENKKGLITLKKKFFDILAMHGLKEIEAIGKKFNPDFHEALCKELSEHNDDEIMEEIQKGYMLHSKVIRTSKVKVAKKNTQQKIKLKKQEENENGKANKEKSN